MNYLSLIAVLVLFIGCAPKIYEKVDEPALFSDCQTMDCHKAKVAAFVHGNRKFTKEILSAGMEGVATIRLVISKDGKLSDASIKEDPGHGMGTEALRIVQLMKEWTPAKVNGQAVDSAVEVKVPFYFE